MSDYAPVPLSSRSKATKLSNLEQNFIVPTFILGGSGYSGGAVSGPFPGAVGAERIKRSRWITNDRKTEPYSYLSFSARISTIPAASTRTVYVPVGSLLTDATPVAMSVRYDGGPATWNGTVNLYICNSALQQLDFSSTPLTLQQLVSGSTATATWSNLADQAQNYLTFSVFNSAGVVPTDWTLMALFKAKHV